MDGLARLELLLKSQQLYAETGDAAHLGDIERILEYDESERGIDGG